MPVVEVRSLPHARDCNLILARLCQEVAAVEGGDASGVWATWQFVSHYVVGRQDASSQPPGSHGPIVRLLALEGRSLEVPGGETRVLPVPAAPKITVRESPSRARAASHWGGVGAVRARYPGARGRPAGAR
ncbi:hypothetical protein DYH09_17080 [bacterium CPR1]|nr:hypothetical protein [bacterium CPR1]